MHTHPKIMAHRIDRGEEIEKGVRGIGWGKERQRLRDSTWRVFNHNQKVKLKNAVLNGAYSITIILEILKPCKEVHFFGKGRGGRQICDTIMRAYWTLFIIYLKRPCINTVRTCGGFYDEKQEQRTSNPHQIGASSTLLHTQEFAHLTKK